MSYVNENEIVVDIELIFTNTVHDDLLKLFYSLQT